MKVRLQEAMPDIPLNELKEQREIHEKGRIESDGEQEQILENQGVAPEQEKLHGNQEAEPNDDDKDSDNENKGDLQEGLPLVRMRYNDRR